MSRGQGVAMKWIALIILIVVVLFVAQKFLVKRR